MTMRLKSTSLQTTLTCANVLLNGVPHPAVSSEDPARILRVDQVLARTGLSRTTLWRLERHGTFPRRRQLSPGAVGWLESEVQAWILSRLTRAAHAAGDGNSQRG